MAPQVVSRTQRRMKKKQALILLGLILAVALVSFSLGILVGRNGSRGTSPAPTRVPAATRLPVAPTQPTAGSAPAAAPAAGQDKLTFYDTLPKGKQPPLGSGINLPPKSSPQGSPSVPAAADSGASATPPAPRAVTQPAPPLPAAKETPQRAAPTAAAAGAYLVQVASFQKAGDARALKKRLAAKGYPTFTRQADLGHKGIWHRVFVGPYTDSAAASRAVKRLKAEEKLSAIVKKR
jgi:DedD protein